MEIEKPQICGHWRNGKDYQVLSPGPVNDRYFSTIAPYQLGFSGFNSYNMVVTNHGFHNLEFLIDDQEICEYDSRLLVVFINVV